MSNGNGRTLEKALGSWQVFFITISAVIGTGLFSFDGLAIRIAGPAGYLIATGFVGIVAICFMDGLSEMIQRFPCTNALVHFVRVFVDEDLAVCIGWAYWAAWSALFALQIAAAAEYASAWLYSVDQLAMLILRCALYIACPIVLLLINVCDIRWFGRIESVAGGLKLLLSISIGFMLYYLAGNIAVSTSGSAEALTRRDNYLAKPFETQRSKTMAAGNTLVAISLVSFSWGGLESVAVSAFETITPEALRLPAQRVPLVVFLIYIVCGTALAMSVDYFNTQLAQPYVPSGLPNAGSQNLFAPGTDVASNSTTMLVIIAQQVGRPAVATFFNAFLIFSSLTAANTCLYLASRTLYGLGTGGQFPSSKLGKRIQRLTVYLTSRGVPAKGLALSAFVFFWLPFLGLTGLHGAPGPVGNEDLHVGIAAQQFINLAASSATICAWGVECLAFIRYYICERILAKNAGGTSQSGDNGESGDTDDSVKVSVSVNNRRDASSTLLGRFQPWVAAFGLLGCICLVLIFPASILWADQFSTPGRVFLAFQIYCALCRKANRDYRGFYIKFSSTPEGVDEIEEKITDLKSRSGLAP